MLNIFRKDTIFGRNNDSNLPLYYDNIVVEGKTTQETRSGKNLCKPIATATKQNMTFTNNGDGSYTLNGTAQANTSFYMTGLNYPAGTYTFCANNPTTNSNGGFYFQVEPSASGRRKTFTEINAKMTFTINTAITAWVVVVPSGLQLNNFVIRPQLEVGNQATEFEPYGVMPSPDYPSELVSVGYENLFSSQLEQNAWNNSNGTTTVYSTQYIRTKDFMPIKSNTIYCLSYVYSNRYGNILYYDENKTFISSINMPGTLTFTTLNNAKYIKLNFYNANGISPTDVLNILLTEGTQAHSYIPYGKYGIEVKTTGKNLFDVSTSLSKRYINKNTGNIGTSDDWSASDFIEIKPSTTYIYSGVTQSWSTVAGQVFYDKDKNYISSIGSNTYSFTTPANAKYIRLSLNSETPNNVMLEQGTQATPYEPYIGHINLITLDEPLRSIGDTKDLLYIKNGMLYVERKIGKVVLNGSENWVYHSVTQGSLFRNTNKIINAKHSLSPLCDYYVGIPSSTNRQNNNIYINYQTATEQWLDIIDNRYSNVNDFKNWLSTHNTEVQYVLATPTFETYELDTQSMIFDSLGYGTLSDVVSDPLITEELNGSYILEFEYMKNGKFSEYLVEENIIKANGEPFSIYSVEKDTDEKIKILAKHWVINEWDKDFILDSAPTDLAAQNALAWIQQRSINHSDISISGDCTTTSTARYVRKNMLDAIFKEDNSILTRFGGELSYNKNSVSVNNHRGSTAGLTIRQGKNLTGAKYYLDFSTVTTRLVPVGKDGLMLDEVYVDSPLINNYVTPIIRKVEVNTDSKDELRSYCNKLYDNGLDKPSISIKIDFIELSKTDEYKQYSNLETANLGDEVIAYIPSLNLNVSTRIVKTVYNDNLNRITKLELGSVTPNIATSSVNVEKNLQKQVEQLAANDSLVLDEAKEEASNLIKHPFGGYIYIDETTGNMYIMDTNNINTAQNVWRWGLGGLGFSSTGVNGTYGIAMTQDGKIVADYIKSGTLQSITIKATNGTVGGYKIGENMLYAETYSSHNFDSSDLTAIRNYLMDEGSLSDDELIKYDIDGDGIVSSRDYVLIRNFIALGVTTAKSAKIIMQTGNNIFENAYILQDADENDILNINFNGFKYDHPESGQFNLTGGKLTLTDLNNNSIVITPGWLPNSVLSNWYSTSSTTLTDAKKHKLLVILGKPASSSGIVTLTIPTDSLSTSNQQFQCADESKYVAFNIRYNNDDIIITGAGRNSDGGIVSAWTLL